MTCQKYKEPIKYTKHKQTQENTRPTIKRGPQEILSTTETEYMSERSRHKSKLKVLRAFINRYIQTKFITTHPPCNK